MQNVSLHALPLTTIAGWLAPVATIVAAMMTAANLGARVTGWGFVVFVVGSVSWSIIGVSTGQTNLVATNGFLTLVNAVGVWRWLAKQRAYEDGGEAAKTASRHSAAPTLFTASGLAGMTVNDPDGRTLGTTVEALLECETGQVSYVVVSSGGVGGVAEDLRAVALDAVRFGSDVVTLQMSRAMFAALPVLEAGNWPESAPTREPA